MLSTVNAELINKVEKLPLFAFNVEITAVEVVIPEADKDDPNILEKF
jgi:hypothetical protein